MDQRFLLGLLGLLRIPIGLSLVVVENSLASGYIREIIESPVLRVDGAQIKCERQLETLETS